MVRLLAATDGGAARKKQEVAKIAYHLLAISENIDIFRNLQVISLLFSTCELFS